MLARDRPSPYGEVPFFPVVRGPVPRERWIAGARTMARDRPAPYDERGLSAAAPVGAPPYCIETRRSLLPGTPLTLRPGTARQQIYETPSFIDVSIFGVRKARQ